uniref:Uncharacterized protein n=1 Tax=Romanomermis culicivorax TaxID=13658 RepID=A0A915KET5_ROMCU
AKFFLKGDYGLHIKQSSCIAKHCSSFALSDPMDKDLLGLCKYHNYDLKGDNCQQINDVIEETQLKLNDMTFSNHLD